MTALNGKSIHSLSPRYGHGMSEVGYQVDAGPNVFGGTSPSGFYCRYLTHKWEGIKTIPDLVEQTKHLIDWHNETNSRALIALHGDTWRLGLKEVSEETRLFLTELFDERENRIHQNHRSMFSVVRNSWSRGRGEPGPGLERGLE